MISENTPCHSGSTDVKRSNKRPTRIAHPDPTPINQALDQLIKGAEMMMHSCVLLQAEVQPLQEANQAANRRHRRPRKRLQHGGTLTV
ncbi:hypothetical protein V1507DRAFT_454657 [Lipomyces tetrasporus]